MFCLKDPVFSLRATTEVLIVKLELFVLRTSAVFSWCAVIYELTQLNCK